MREFVGIKSALDLILEMKSKDATIESLFKREALMFDRIICPFAENFNATLAQLGVSPLDDLAAQIAYLNEQGLILADIPMTDVSQLGLLESDSEFQRLRSAEEPLTLLVRRAMENAGLGELLDGRSIEPHEINDYLSKMNQDVAISFVIVFQHYIRRLSVQLRVLKGMEAYPVLSDLIPQLPLQQPKKNETVSVTFNALPMPDDSVSWEQIFEYRADPDSQSKFLALRNWINEAARAELTPAELEVKLEHLVDQYRQHMKRHRMKTNVDTLETVITTSVEVLGDLVSFKWGKAAQALFSLKKREVALLDGEAAAPGNAVAYIVKARETFS
jgi:hypothetical protein